TPDSVGENIRNLIRWLSSLHAPLGRWSPLAASALLVPARSNHHVPASNRIMMKRLAFIIAGWVLLMLGAIGLFLPILPGVLLSLVSFSILSVLYPWARRWVSSLLHRSATTEKRLQVFLARHEKPTSA